jgi:hypothetical protein
MKITIKNSNSYIYEEYLHVDEIYIAIFHLFIRGTHEFFITDIFSKLLHDETTYIHYNREPTIFKYYYYEY